YVIESVRLVADSGERLLPLYRFEPATGLWRHHLGPVEPPLRMTDLSYDADGVLRYPHHDDRLPLSALQDHLTQARRLLQELPPLSADAHLNADFDSLRWFPLPRESVAGGDDSHAIRHNESSHSR
ncbi:MAG: aminotransferase, partial [Actinomycetota bacterium]